MVSINLIHYLSHPKRTSPFKAWDRIKISDIRKTKTLEHAEQLVWTYGQDVLLSNLKIKEILRNNKNKNINVKNVNDFIANIKRFPKYTNMLVNIFINSERDLAELEPIAGAFSTYNDDKNMLYDILFSNQNIKLKKDSDNDRLNKAMEIIKQNPKYKQELVDYLKVQRQVNQYEYDSYDEDLTRYLNVLKLAEKLPEDRQKIVKEMASNRNIQLRDINFYVINYGDLCQCDLDVIHHYNALNYNINGIRTMDFYADKYPDLRPILLAEPPKYHLADRSNEVISNADFAKRQKTKKFVERNFKQETEKLRQIIGKYYYPKIKWEQIVPDINDKEQIKSNLDLINKVSVFFARTVVNEKKYGKNIQWAYAMNNITESIMRDIKSGQKFDLLMFNMGKLYGYYDRSSTYSNNGPSNRNKLSGEFRDTTDYRSVQFSPCCGYPEYRKRFSQAMLKERTLPYPNVNLTVVKDIPVDDECRVIPRAEWDTTKIKKTVRVLYHGYNRAITDTLKQAQETYKKLLPYIKKFETDKKLSADERTAIDNYISEIYFLIINTVPYSRGSNGICDIFMRALYRCFDIEMPALKNGCSLDLEAFCMDLPEYQQKWKTFFLNDCKDTL